MDNMMSMGDLMDESAAVEGVNKRAKMQRQMMQQAQQLRKYGFEPAEIDVLLRGRYGMLEPDEEPSFNEAMRKLSGIGRIRGMPGMEKRLRSWPEKAGAGANTQDAMRALEALGFGGGGMMSLDDLMGE